MKSFDAAEIERKTVCIRNGVFDEIIPLEKMAIVTIGGVEISLQP